LVVVLFEDAAAVAGLVVAAVFTALSAGFGLPVLDGVASLVIGTMLLGVALILGNETRSLLVGESNPAITAYVRERAAQIPGITRVNQVLTEQRGPQSVIVMVSLDWQNDVRAGAVEEAHRRLDADIRARFPEVTSIFTEVEWAAAAASGRMA